MGRLGALVVGALLALASILGAEEASSAAAPAPGLSSEGHWNWDTGEFVLTLRLPLPADPDANPPKRRYRAELEAQGVLAQEFVRRVGDLPAASGQTLAELSRQDPALEAGLVQVAEGLRFVSSRVDEDYQNLEMVWATGLWTNLAPLISDQPEANAVPARFAWSPSRDFSGLVIFAMGDLSWLGTGLKARWSPSLTFRLLDPTGEVVFDPTMADPTFLHRWGQAAVSLGKFNEDRFRDRIGFDPLRIVARGVWGARPGDLVLAQADWDRLLSRPANRRLLAEGRVLVLYGPFPDYVQRPNPDSAIDEEKPPVEVIPEPPEVVAPAAPGAAAEH